VCAGAQGRIGTSKDPSSYSNVEQFAPKHISFDIAVSFEESSTAGSVTHTMTVLESNVTTVFLDIRDGLEVTNAEFRTGEVKGFADFVEVSFNITTPNPNIGNALAVELPLEMANGTEFFLRFTYKTNPENSAISWMTPAQTAGKVLPFMYSLCEMNFCRDLAPMMDTPSMKLTYDAKVLTPKEFTVLMSANETSAVDYNDTHKVTTFECTVKIPSYLIAILVGDLAIRSLSNRVNVMSEPVLLDKAFEEMSELPQALSVAEEYLSPYIWGNYTIVFMPPRYAPGLHSTFALCVFACILVSASTPHYYDLSQPVTCYWYYNSTHELIFQYSCLTTASLTSMLFT
jgi:leukotriene-A4 hydrolase